MREADNIRAVEALGIDWMGFIFWPRSSRYVSEPPAYLPTRCRRVGVFVDADVDDILRHIGDYTLDVVQLHGHESAAHLRALRAENTTRLRALRAESTPRLRTQVPVPDGESSGLTLIKAFNIATPADLDQTADYDGLADYFLFDTKGHCAGGNGEQFDWSVLDHYHGHTPFLLSGGIGPDDGPRLRDFHHPRWAGIDLNSRFELAPAQKDIQQLKSFLYEQNQHPLL